MSGDGPTKAVSRSNARSRQSSLSLWSRSRFFGVERLILTSKVLSSANRFKPATPRVEDEFATSGRITDVKQLPRLTGCHLLPSSAPACSRCSLAIAASELLMRIRRDWGVEEIR